MGLSVRVPCPCVRGCACQLMRPRDWGGACGEDEQNAPWDEDATYATRFSGPAAKSAIYCQHGALLHKLLHACRHGTRPPSGQPRNEF